MNLEEINAYLIWGGGLVVAFAAIALSFGWRSWALVLSVLLFIAYGILGCWRFWRAFIDNSGKGEASVFLLVGAVAILLALAVLRKGLPEIGLTAPVVTPLLIAVLGLVVFVFGSLEAIHRYRVAPRAKAELESSPSEPQEPKPSLGDLFVSDFDGLASLANSMSIKTETEEVSVSWKVISNHAEGSKFIAALLPRSASLDPTIATSAVIDQHQAMLTHADNVEVNIRDLGEETIRSKDLRFSGRIYIYHRDDIDIIQRGELVRLGREKNLLLQFRGSTYLIGKVLSGNIKQQAQRKEDSQTQ